MSIRNRIRLRVEELERRLAPAAHTFSTNWAGYAVNTPAAAVSHVKGDWVVPPVASNVSGYSSAWVGIDGWSSSTVEQIGTDSDYVNGQAQYYAWYEMYPAAAVNLTMAVHAGDHISASVTYTGASQFVLSISNVTTGGSFTTTQTSASAQRSSAEWIQEAPSSFTGVLPLANFGTINFSGASATVGGTAGPADNTWAGSTLNQVDMVTRRGALKASTSTLTDSGTPSTSSFSVTFVSSGSGGHGGGKKSTNIPPAQLNALVAGAALPAAASVLSAAPTIVATAPPMPASPAVMATPRSMGPVFVTSTPALSQSGWDGIVLGDNLTQSKYLPPSTMTDNTPAPASPTTPPAAPQMDPTPVPADGAADAGQLEAIPLNGIRLSSELLDGANGVFNGMHEGHSFAFAALFLTLALERAWHRRTPGQSEKQKSVRGRSGEDPDHLRFRPNTTSA